MSPPCKFCGKGTEDLEDWLECHACGATAELKGGAWTWRSPDYNRGYEAGFEAGRKAGIDEAAHRGVEGVMEKAKRAVARYLYDDVHLSQHAIGKALGMSQTSVSRILSGPRPAGAFQKGYAPPPEPEIASPP